MKTIGTRMKELREDHDLTQSALSEKLGMSRNSIATYERDNSIPSIDVLLKYADFFNVTTDYLLGRVNDKEIKVIENRYVRMLVKQDSKDKEIQELKEKLTRIAKLISN